MWVQFPKEVCVRYQMQVSVICQKEVCVGCQIEVCEVCRVEVCVCRVSNRDVSSVSDNRGVCRVSGSPKNSTAWYRICI